HTAATTSERLDNSNSGNCATSDFPEPRLGTNLSLDQENLDQGIRTFSRVVGVGGIGFGICFELEGNHDLGRSESRPAKLTDARDYCKLHIIMHYLAT